MQQLLKSEQRGHANHGWLDTYHTFSFADYYNPNFMGYRDLRVINEDRIVGGAGFPLHAHQNMEILTYILEGELEHKDTLGNQEVIRPGELQRMSAGSGIRHAEFNHSSDKPVHLLQIWILTEKDGIAPGYEQKNFKDQIAKQKLTLVGSREGKNNSLKIHQDANVYIGKLNKGDDEKFELPKNRYAWIQVARGSLTINDLNLKAGDGLALSETSMIQFRAMASAEFLLFDLK